MAISPVSTENLAILRSDKQSSDLMLAFPDSHIIFQARINQTFKKIDSVVQLVYDTVTFGSYSAIVPGMTLWVGSTAGACDIGIARIRKNASSTKLFIGEISEVRFADNLYLTVVDDVSIWQRNIRIIGKTQQIFQDYENDYSNQHAPGHFKPIAVCMINAVVELVGDTCSMVFDASDSFVPSGTIAAYEFDCSPTATIIGGDTATPTIEFDAVGTYFITCRVTSNGGVVAGTYGKVKVWDAAHPLVTKFELTGSPTLSMAEGGVTFTVEMRGEVDRSIIHDRAQVFLVAEDYYGDTKISLGQVPGRENLVATGWIIGETISPDVSAGSVTFEVGGTQYWMKKMFGFVVGVENTWKTPNEWTQIKKITLDLMLWHYFTWQTTLPLCTPIYLTGDTRLAEGFKVPDGNFWQQIVQLAETSIFAVPCTDQYGRLFVRIDPQMLSDTVKAGWTPIMSLTDVDIEDGSLKMTRRTTPSIASLYFSAVALPANTKKPKAYFAIAPGHSPAHYGDKTTNDNYLVANQAQAVNLAGRLYAKMNNEFDISFTIPQNNRVIGICPDQVIHLSIPADRSPRGVAFEGNVIPRQITLVPRDGAFVTAVTAEPVVPQGIAIIGDIQDAPIPPNPPDPPTPFPKPPVPPIVIVPGFNTNVRALYLLVPEWGVLYTDSFGLPDVVWYWMAGIEDTDLVSLAYLDATPSGRVYTGTFNSIYSGDPVGGAFARFVDVDWLAVEFPAANPDFLEISGLGPSMVDDDTIAFSCGAGDNAGIAPGIYISVSGEMSHVPITSDVWAAILNGVGGRWTFAGGEWLGTPRAYLDRPSFLHCEPDGTITLIKAWGEDGRVGGFHDRGGTGTRVAAYLGGGGTGSMALSDNDLVDYTEVANSDSTSSFDLDPTGSVLLMVRHIEAGNLWISTGGGEATLVTIPGDIIPDAVVALSPTQFIISGPPPGGSGHAPFKVYYSEDAGTTWNDRSGNLAEVLPDPTGNFITRMVAT